ncbi:MAG: hypothetical protein C4326_02595 [Ignavibacteria bacterium]
MALIRIPSLHVSHSLLLLVVAASCSGIKMPHVPRSTESDWPMFGRTPHRTNATDELVAPPLTIAWEGDLSSSMGYGSPVVVDTFVFVTNMRGELFVFNALTGKRYGWISLGDAFHGSPVIDGAVVYAASADARESLVAYDLFEAKTLWKRDYGDIEVTPLFFDNKLYFGTTAGIFYCVEKYKGEKEWSYRLPENRRWKGIRSSAALFDGTVIFGAEDGNVYALDAKNGRERWTYDTGAPIFASPTVYNGTVFIGNFAGTFVALDAQSGTPRWRFPTGASIYAAASFAGNLVLIGNTAGKLFALSTTEGSIRWSIEFNSVINSSAVVSGPVAYVGTLKKELIAVKVQDGTIVWRQTLNGRVKTTPAVARGRLFVATDDRMVLALEPMQHTEQR